MGKNYFSQDNDRNSNNGKRANREDPKFFDESRMYEKSQASNKRSNKWRDKDRPSKRDREY